MTPQQFVTQNNGKVIGSGQCGELIDLALVEIYGNHTEYATALEYWTNGIPGFSVVSGPPQDGDIGCYNAHPGFPDGHITMHYQGEEFEQNADPDGSVAHLYPRATTYLLGYLRGGTMEPPINDGDMVAWAIMSGLSVTTLTNLGMPGKGWKEGFEFLLNRPEYVDTGLPAQLKEAQAAANATYTAYSGPQLFTKS